MVLFSTLWVVGGNFMNLLPFFFNIVCRGTMIYSIKAYTVQVRPEI